MSQEGKLIVIAAFDDKKGPVPIFSTVKSDLITNKIAIKSIVSTLSARDTNKEKIEGEAIIPFPDEDLIGFIYYVSLDQKTETGDYRVISLTYLAPSSSANEFYINANVLSSKAKEISSQINKKYLYGQKFTQELISLVTEWGIVAKQAEIKIAPKIQKKQLGLQDLYTFFVPAKKTYDPLSHVLLAFLQEIPVILSGPDPQHIIDFASLLQGLYHLKDLKMELNLTSSEQRVAIKIPRSDIVLLTDNQFRKSFFSRNPVVILTMDQEIKLSNHAVDEKDIARISEWLKRSREKKDQMMASHIIKQELDNTNNRIKQLIYLASLNKEMPIKDICQILSCEKDELEFLCRIVMRTGKIKAELMNKLLKSKNYSDFDDKKDDKLGMINI